jgi:hypothetical protein
MFYAQADQQTVYGRDHRERPPATLQDFSTGPLVGGIIGAAGSVQQPTASSFLMPSTKALIGVRPDEAALSLSDANR